MFILRYKYNTINKLHERCLRIISNVNESFTINFEVLFFKDNSVYIHQRNIQRLATEVYKFANGMSLESTNEIIQLRHISSHPEVFCKKAVYRNSCSA